MDRPQFLKVRGVSNLLICNPKLGEGEAYSIVKAIMENKQDLVIAHKEAENITPKSAVVGSPIPYHPGAVKYYREKGLKVSTGAQFSLDKGCNPLL